MIINSQFFITYYTGKEPLTLKQPPASLVNNPAAKVEYDRFIQSIDTIYGSQKLDGTIPKFWTQRTQTTDQLGNTQYYYTPHPNSDLSQLDSKSAYYFIVRDDTAIPLRIPAIGGLLLGFTDARLLPNIINSTIPNTTLTQTNRVSLSPQIENLQPYEEYLYQFKPTSSNWPVSINSISGIIKPAAASGTINASFGFCPSTGSCDTNILPYSLPPECSLSSTSDKTITMQLSIVPISYEGPEVLSNQFSINCKDCLPKPSVSILAPDSVQESSSDDADPASIDFSLQFDNLEIEQDYEFGINILQAEWPIVFAAPSSGNILLRNSTDTPSVKGKIFFCPTTGLCPPGEKGVPQYLVPTYPKFLTGVASYNITLQASLVSSCQSSEIIYSKPITISYRN